MGVTAEATHSETQGDTTWTAMSQVANMEEGTPSLEGPAAVGETAVEPGVAGDWWGELQRLHATLRADLR